MKWKFWIKPPISVETIESIKRSETELLVFRLGTELCPASPQAVAEFTKHIEEWVLKENLEIPIFVTTSFVNVSAVKKEDEQQVDKFMASLAISQESMKTYKYHCASSSFPNITCRTCGKELVDLVTISVKEAASHSRKNNVPMWIINNTPEGQEEFDILQKLDKIG